MTDIVNVIYTDRPLDFLPELPPLKKTPSALSNTKELPPEYRARLKLGVMELIDWTSIMKFELHGHEPLEGEWWAYIYNYGESTIWDESKSPIFDQKSCFITFDLLLVYWYLAHVGATIAIEFSECAGFGSEIPVSRIDISDYGIGQRPMAGYRRGGVRYVFTDKSKKAASHETFILDYAASHQKTESSLWRSVQTPTTLRELIGQCGNAISRVSLFDRSILSPGAKIPDSTPSDGKIPVPFADYSITSSGVYAKEDYIEGILDLRTIEDYLMCNIVSYMLYCKDSVCRCKIPNIGNEIGLAVVLENVP